MIFYFHYAYKPIGLSTRIFKMLIKYFGNIFLLSKIIFNIAEGNNIPVLTNPSIYYPSAYYGGVFFVPVSTKCRRFV